jgi:hypothetical protein
MMRFTVIWTASTRDDLAKLWLSATNRSATQRAADDIDRRLRTDAHLLGQPFFEDRMLVVPPLAVVFSVSLPDCLVTVWQVWSRGLT